MADVVGADTDALDPKNHQRFIDQVDAINDFTKGFPSLLQIVPIQRTDNDKAIAAMVAKMDDLMESVHTFESELIFKGGWKVLEQRSREQLLEDLAQDKGNKANESFGKQ